MKDQGTMHLETPSADKCIIGLVSEGVISTIWHRVLASFAIRQFWEQPDKLLIVGWTDLQSTS